MNRIPTSRSRITQRSSEKVWGREIWITNTALYCGKHLYLNKGYQCSLHYHKIKDETFHLLSGEVRFELGAEVSIMEPGDTIHVPAQTPHRFSGLEQSHILEISTFHSEDDVVRLEASRPMNDVNS